MTKLIRYSAIDNKNLSEGTYFASLLQEGIRCNLFTQNELENIQSQSLELLVYKTKQHVGESSSSVRTEIAESLMLSNLYTIGIFLKSLPTPDDAIDSLKNENISDLYQNGRRIVETKFKATRHIYTLVERNKIPTKNQSYIDTLTNGGIDGFFKTYDFDFQAHETPGLSIDYQLCNPVNEFLGVEYVQKYLENLFCENEFCKHFDAKRIHRLMLGYSRGYKDLLMNIFSQVLTNALGCVIIDKPPLDLSITDNNLKALSKTFSNITSERLALLLSESAEKLTTILNIRSASLVNYINKSLRDVEINIEQAVKTQTLANVFPKMRVVKPAK